MLEAAALTPHQARLEWIGRIEAQPVAEVPAGPVGKVLDAIDIILATSLGALFAIARR